MCVCDFREGGFIDPTLKPQIKPYRLPKFIKKFLSVILKPIVSLNHILIFLSRLLPGVCLQKQIFKLICLYAIFGVLLCFSLSPESTDICSHEFNLWSEVSSCTQQMQRIMFYSKILILFICCSTVVVLLSLRFVYLKQLFFLLLKGPQQNYGSIMQKLRSQFISLFFDYLLLKNIFSNAKSCYQFLLSFHLLYGLKIQCMCVLKILHSSTGLSRNVERFC